MIIIKKKFFYIFILLVSLGVVISGVLSVSLLKTNYEESVRDNLIENSQIIKLIIEEDDRSLEWKFSFVESLEDKINSRITLINDSGMVEFDTEADAGLLDNHSNRPEVMKANEGNIGVAKRYSDSVEKEMYYVAIPVDSDEIKVVRLSIPLKTMTEYSNSIVGNIVIATIVGVVLATMLGARFLNMFTGPLEKLTEATRNIAKGNFGEQVYIASEDEIGELADSFNLMSTELDKRINELKESNMTNRAILKSMINGVIAIDNNYNIMFVNKAAQEMFNINEHDVKNKKVIEVFKGHILENLFNDNFDVDGNIQSELEITEPVYKVYRVFSNIIRDHEKTLNTMGFLMNFVDITQMRNLENMRKDFVANVSHELKTPLTSIQGFIETLKEGAAEKKEIRDKFIDIIDIEANRLRLLIDDILVLSDIEKTGSTSSKYSNVNISEVIDEISEMMLNISAKKNISITYNIQEKMAPIYGNKVWLKQLFINLIDNAVKYSYENGNVTVSVNDIMNHFVISVKDNGIGIEPEHIERLFERFYRVDKARSKKVGGTGLGLAIVKHIVLALKGDISVNSEIEKGTEFIIRIPKKFNQNM